MLDFQDGFLDSQFPLLLFHRAYLLVHIREKVERLWAFLLVGFRGYMVGCDIDAADKKLGIYDAVEEFQYRRYDFLRGGGRLFKVDRAVGRGWPHAPEMVDGKRPGIEATHRLVPKALPVVTDV